MAHGLMDSAKVHIDRGNIDAAILDLTDRLNDKFHDPEALFMLGACLIGKGKHGLGAIITEAALKARPKFPEAMLNLGACYKTIHDNAAAEKIWRAALDIEEIPAERSKLWAMIGGCYINAGTPELALEPLAQAVNEDPSNYGAQFNRSLAYLELGRYREGWADYGKSLLTGDRLPRRYLGLPEWDGEPGKRIIVWGDQGVGDEVMFASCLQDLIQVSQSVIFDCHPRLETIFTRSFPSLLAIHGTRKQLSNLEWLRDCEADATICLSELPKFFRNELRQFPGLPFLTPDHAKVQEYKRESVRPRVGIAWAGGTDKTHAHERSMQLTLLEPMLRTINADFYSLQYTKDASEAVCQFEERTGIHVSHYPGVVHKDDMDDFFSLIASMDAVVSVDQTLVHQSGALGIPTLVMLPKHINWRYPRSGLSVPWYKSAVLFRQETLGDWAPVVRDATIRLRTEIEKCKRPVARFQCLSGTIPGSL